MRGGRVSTLAGIALISLLALLAAIAPLAGLHSPNDVDVAIMLAPPNGSHFLGTDELGRDVLARAVHAGRISLTIALIAALTGLVFGTAIGLTAAFFGGWVDLVLMRVVELLLSFPAVLLALVLMAGTGNKLANVTVVIGIIFIPGFARLARVSAGVVLRETHVLAAYALGMNRWGVLRRRILPSISGVLAAETAAALSYAVMFEAAFSFLGLGVEPPDPSWGAMLDSGRGFMAEAPWLVLVPGGAMFLAALGWNLIGDGLRDLSDPLLV